MKVSRRLSSHNHREWLDRWPGQPYLFPEPPLFDLDWPQIRVSGKDGRCRERTAASVMPVPCETFPKREQYKNNASCTKLEVMPSFPSLLIIVVTVTKSLLSKTVFLYPFSYLFLTETSTAHLLDIYFRIINNVSILMPLNFSALLIMSHQGKPQGHLASFIVFSLRHPPVLSLWPSFQGCYIVIFG